MSLGARFYVTTDGFEDEAGARAVRGRLGRALKQRLRDGLITGYEVTAVVSEDDWEDEGMDRGIIEAVTDGRLPAVCVNITVDIDNARQSAADHGDLIEAFALRLAWEVSPNR